MRPRLAAFLAAVVLAGPVLAQERSDAVRWSSAITVVGQAEADLDGGGRAGFVAAIATLDAFRRFDARFAAGLGLRYDVEDWSFDGTTAFGRAAWGTLHRPALAVPLVWSVRPDVDVALTPSVQWSFERGASTSDAVVAGALVSATRRFSQDLSLGLGVGAFDDLEETRVFPVVVVDWRIDERWRLGNPFRAGPAGGAGLELAYEASDAWELGAGATWRSARFRLSRDGPVAGGIGEARAVPLFVRASWRPARDVRLDVHAGATVGGKLAVMDAEGRDLVEDDVDTAPFLGVTLRTRF
jgi:hypothetical protein